MHPNQFLIAALQLLLDGLAIGCRQISRLVEDIDLILLQFRSAQHIG